MDNKNTDVMTENKANKSKPFFKSKKAIILIIVGAILIVAGLVVGGSFILPKDISGAWELTVNPEIAVATADEIPESEKVYYVFDKPDRYGKGSWHICYQGGIEYYKYELLEEDGTEKINLGSENLIMKITGSKLLGNAKVSLIYPGYTDENSGMSYEAEEYVLEQAKAPDYEKSTYKTYEVDQRLVGEWATNERSLSYLYYTFYYTETVAVKDNGIMTIHYESDDLGLDRYLYYAYTANDSELTFSLVTDKETEYTVSYEFDENGNLKFTDDRTTASVFADAFFGEVTYYNPKELPVHTTADALTAE